MSSKQMVPINIDLTDLEYFVSRALRERGLILKRGVIGDVVKSVGNELQEYINDSLDNFVDELDDLEQFGE